ncbi:unnamed protein product [Tenebrio molitor]|nr:unnamed protein product [Tenebrio molitor]
MTCDGRWKRTYQLWILQPAKTRISTFFALYLRNYRKIATFFLIKETSWGVKKTNCKSG